MIINKNFPINKNRSLKQRTISILILVAILSIYIDLSKSNSETIYLNDGPLIISNNGHKSLVLPKEFVSFIDTNYKNYRIPNNNDNKLFWKKYYGGEFPYICWGDFNGDKYIDIAIILIGMKSDNWKFIIFHGIKNGFKPELEKTENIVSEKINAAQQLILRVVAKDEKWAIEGGDSSVYFSNKKYDSIEINSIIEKKFSNYIFKNLFYWYKGKYLNKNG